MKKYFLLIFSIFILSAYFGCSQTNEPKPPEYKDPREMTWTADTLIVPDNDIIQILPRDMLVLSPDNIWLLVWVGHAQMWLYDGTKWENKRDIGGGINSIVRREGNDIWAGGYSGDFMLLAHYEGAEWITYKMHQSHQLFVGYNARNIKGEILDMCIDEENNLWACGRKGIIFKYDGVNWDVDTIRISNYPIDSYFLKSIEYFDNKLHILCSMFDSALPKEAYFYITGDFQNWSVIDSMLISVQNGYDKWGVYNLFTDHNENLFSYGQNGVWRYESMIWDKILELPYNLRTFCAHRSNYMIVAGSFQKFLYNNGTTWEDINSLLNINDPHFNFTVSWTDGNEIFIGGYTFEGWPQKGIIWHGK